MRWGIATDVLNKYIAHEKALLNNSSFTSATFTSNNDEYLPLPQNEIDLQGTAVLTQNPGY